jgi:hypothetical protein
MRIFLISFCLAYSLIGNAQNKHHVFIQAVQPKIFSVEINHTVFPSSASGLFFLMNPGTPPLELQLSFPPARFPIYQFIIDTTYLDHVIFLEQLADSMWQLMNANTRNSVIGKQLNFPIDIKTSNSIASTDVFLNLLSKAVDDQEIRHTTLIERNDIPQLKSNSLNISAFNVPIANASVIKLIYRNKNAMVYVDKLGSAIDTIKVEIPITLPSTLKITGSQTKGKSNIVQSSVIDSTNSSLAELQIALQQKQELIGINDLVKNTKDTAILLNNVGDRNRLKLNDDVSKIQKSIHDSTTLAKPSQKQVKDTNSVVLLHPVVEIKGSKELHPIVIKQEKSKDSSYVVNTTKRADSIIAMPVSSRNNCKHLADERDLILFRRKMILMNSQKELISFAAIEFKQKCYTTIGIRNLSFIFLNDKDKLQFFELAYTYVYDPENFATLERFLNDSEDINKFRVLLKN